MSPGVLVVVVLVVAGAVVWAVRTARLARANPTQFIPRRANVGWGRYWRFYLAGLFGATLGAVVLPNEVGWWSAAVVLVVVAVPHVFITTLHRRRVTRRLAGGRG